MLTEEARISNNHKSTVPSFLWSWRGEYVCASVRVQIQGVARCPSKGFGSVVCTIGENDVSDLGSGHPLVHRSRNDGYEFVVAGGDRLVW